jgi:iron-chelate-transporting ATPase
VLLLDEPTNHLDLRYQVETLDLIDELAHRHSTAVGVVLHDLDQAAAVADRVVVLAQGRVVADGIPSEALTGPLLTEVYGIEVAIDLDETTGLLRTRAVGRHSARPRLHHERTAPTP